MNKIILMLLCCVLGLPAMAQEELVSTTADQQAVALTLYGDDLALVRDSRRVQLPSGHSRLAFTEISAQIRPQTARLYGGPIAVLAQTFDFDLLTPQTLLEKFVGREISVARINPATGAEQMQRATLLAVTNSTAVFRVGNRIETDNALNPWRFIFDELPEGLRERPTLVLELEAADGGEHTLDLAYLSGGLSWQADYLATLNEGSNSLDLVAWATLNNTSGTTYRNAQVQLMAGDVHRVREEREVLLRMEKQVMAEPAVREEQVFEYHLSTLERPVTLTDNQSKQVMLLHGGSVPVEREFRVSAPITYYHPVPEGQELPVHTILHFSNDEPALGRPLPAGVMRFYQLDSTGAIQFIGENRIDHTPPGKDLNLEVGRAFDITARRRQTSFNRLARDVTESAWEVAIHNAKQDPVTVEVLETFPGDWQIVEESLPHNKETAQQVRWSVSVPANDKAVLSYRIRTR